jgi:hypothetical protein
MEWAEPLAKARTNTFTAALCLPLPQPLNTMFSKDLSLGDFPRNKSLK